MKKNLLEFLPKEHLHSVDFLKVEDISTTKTLEVRWNATTDDLFCCDWRRVKD